MPLSTSIMDASKVHKGKHVGLKERALASAKRAREDTAPNGLHAKRAFGVAKLGRSKRTAQRTADKDQAKQVLPQLDRTSKSKPPPIVVVVAGPKGSGKSTLIRSVVKLYSRHSLKDVLGPITVVLGKDKRVTLVECPDDLPSMIDLGKIADVVLLMIDASFGFEMSTFELISVLQTHGFPKVAGVLTRLDTIKQTKAVQKTKKVLKHRFWEDVYQGAKLFAMSGVLKSGKYPRNETRQLALFLQRQKLRPLTWRNAHSYALCDRVDFIGDGTTVDMYGWLRGCRHSLTARVHVPGLGDFVPFHVQALQDPLPSFKEVKEKGEALKRKKAETLLYAPLSAVAGVSLDNDEVAIKLEKPTYDNPDHPSYNSEGVQMIRDLQQVDGRQLQRNTLQIRLYDNGQLASLQLDGKAGEESKIEVDQENERDQLKEESPKKKGPAVEDRYLRFSEGDVVDLGPTVYGRDDSEEVEDDDEEDDDTFFVPKGERLPGERKHFRVDDTDDVDFIAMVDVSEETLEAAKSLCLNRDGGSHDVDDQGYFHVLDDDDAGQHLEAEDEQARARRINAEQKAKAALAREDEGDGDGGLESMGYHEKRRLEAMASSDEARLENVDDEVAGLENGRYVRFRLCGVPSEFQRHWDARRPVMVCGLLDHEKEHPGAAALLTARLRRHRWHAKILKSRDPVVISVGWRRFQAAPLFSIEDRAQTRHRFLKYTPEHMHCDATFVGPSVAPNSPIIGFHSLRGDADSFRACLTGVVTGVGAASRVVKKLKLQGFPYKVERNTAFVEGMFNSALEVAKFEGAQIKTVSGIRGAIKKAVSVHKEGAFRATFEDKIVLSDIVTCRLWVSVEPPKFCAPIASHLVGYEDDSYERLAPMRTVAQVRRDEHIPIPVNIDSVYGATPIDRSKPRKFAPQVLPKTLIEKLPFASKPKQLEPKSKKSRTRGYLAKRAKFFTVPAEKQDRAATKLLQAFSTIRNERISDRRAKRHARSKSHAAEVERRHQAAEPKRKAQAKRTHAIQGQQLARKRAKFAHASPNVL